MVADLVDTQLLIRFNKWIRFYCGFDVFSKYAWLVPLKDKKGIVIANVFQNKLDESRHKPKNMGCQKAVNFITNHWSHS